MARCALRPWEYLTEPQFGGWENLPRDRPVMLVGNHTLMGVLDVPFLILAVYEKMGYYVRSLGDHWHFAVPIWRDLLAHFGVVDGTRANCRALMRKGESLLVYPGGGREVFKRKGEAYQLLWGQRSGFARLALEFDYTIVPVAAVGAEDCYSILIDANDVLRLPCSRLIQSLSPRADIVFPTLVYGWGGTPLPRPQKFYFSFGEPINSAGFHAYSDAEMAVTALRDATHQRLSQEIAKLRKEHHIGQKS
jgi:1-acyl-sn-glycerol-3-phosphate acyltransferase